MLYLQKVFYLYMFLKLSKLNRFVQRLFDCTTYELSIPRFFLNELLYLFKNLQDTSVFPEQLI